MKIEQLHEPLSHRDPLVTQWASKAVLIFFPGEGFKSFENDKNNNGLVKLRVPETTSLLFKFWF